VKANLPDVARSIKADPAFLTDLDQVVETYRFWHEHDCGPKAAASRAALRKFDKLTDELCEWLASALGTDETPERLAARKINAASLERRLPAFERIESARYALLELSTLRDRAAQFLTADKSPKAAPRMAASYLWTLLPHYNVKVTMYENSAAVRLLVAIARDAGDRTLTLQAAKKFLRETRPK
jgi:hypothetical protein